jgi:hypothetical protein
VRRSVTASAKSVTDLQEWPTPQWQTLFITPKLLRTLSLAAEQAVRQEGLPPVSGGKYFGLPVVLAQDEGDHRSQDDDED